MNKQRVGNKTYWELLVNGKGVDLAYTYVQRTAVEGEKQMVNLALLAGCRTEGVTQIFNVGE